MLSRVADAIYWVSRYIERAENVARFVDVNQSMSLGGTSQWAPLIFSSGDEEMFGKLYGDFSHANVLEFLLFNEENPNSILSCLIKARENARTIRDILSVSLWEAINRFYLRMREASRDAAKVRANPASFLERVKRGSHEVIGVYEATMSHGEAWHFARMGRLLERADKTSRILDVKYYILLPAASQAGSMFDVVQWSALLESTSALHMYRKRFGRIAPYSVAEFLMLDPQFPRSIRFCVEQCEISLQGIVGSGDSADSVPDVTVRDELKRLRARLESVTIGEIFQIGLHEFIDECQLGLNAIGAAVYHDFFEVDPQDVFQAQQ